MKVGRKENGGKEGWEVICSVVIVIDYVNWVD